MDALSTKWVLALLMAAGALTVEGERVYKRY